MIETFGKGALPDLPDERDYKADAILSATPPVDWTLEFRLPNPGDEDQGTSNSCVAQAFSYYHNQIHPADYSRRDLYSRIAQRGGGAYLRDGASQIVGKGQATRDEIPDPHPETEAGMTAGSGSPIQESSHVELNFFSVGSDIESIAKGVRDYRGVVFGIYGTNPGWQNMSNPRPPGPNETVWGHALYVMGYHTHNGKKCLICKSSWCSVVSEHHINEDYLTSGNTFNAWTLIPKEQQVTNNIQTVAFKKQQDDTVYVQVGSILVPIADWNAATTLGITQASVIELTPDQFSKFTVGSGDLFKSA